MDDRRRQIRKDAAQGALTLEGATADPPTQFNRSLLRIKVSASVTLAAKKLSVGQIVEIAPGALLRFDNRCGQPLDLELSGKPVARGQCVQVGTGLGLRITQFVGPHQRADTADP